MFLRKQSKEEIRRLLLAYKRERRFYKKLFKLTETRHNRLEAINMGINYNDYVRRLERLGHYDLCYDDTTFRAHDISKELDKLLTSKKKKGKIKMTEKMSCSY